MLAKLLVKQLLLFAVLISGSICMNGVFRKYQKPHNKLISNRIAFYFISSDFLNFLIWIFLLIKVKGPPESLCTDCFNIPCQLTSFSMCNLAWLYDAYLNPDFITFYLVLDTPPLSSWIGIVFNAANKSTDLLMVIFFESLKKRLYWKPCKRRPIIDPSIIIFDSCILNPQVIIF